MIRASSPSEQSFLAQWCALELASIAPMHPAANCEHQAMNLSLASARPVISRPEASTACTWITRLARSTPTRTTTPPHSPRVICSTDFPLQWLEIDDFEHHQSWRYDAVAEGGKSLRIQKDFRRCQVEFGFIEHERLIEARSDGDGLNEEQTASLEMALLHAAASR